MEINGQGCHGAAQRRMSMNYQRQLKWIVPPLIVISMLFWYMGRETLPGVIRIAAGQSHGHYDAFARALEVPYWEETGRGLEVLSTTGSVANGHALRAHKADFAIMQAGAAEMDGLAALVPLFPEVVYMVVRKDLDDVRQFSDLQGKRLILGPDGSGMRMAAEDLLRHYGLTLTPHEFEHGAFALLKDHEEIDGAIVTTGFPSEILDEVLQTGAFKLLPVVGEALAHKHAYFTACTIPAGAFAHGKLPETTIQAVSTRAFLAVEKDAPEVLVTEVLDAIYNHDLSVAVPSLIAMEDAARWRIFPMHKASRAYFEPYKGIDLIAKFMGSLAGAKELLFSLVAGFYLLWQRRSYLREKDVERRVKTQRDMLDAFLEKTFEVERKQMDETDPVLLKRYLDEVTRTKLEALEELTHKELMGDRRFLIFLSQCANLSRKVESKLLRYVETEQNKAPDDNKERQE
jgi:TRAP transporter TAXI family solute receptor